MAPPTLVTGPPDFVGVGTQRSGTAWWFRLLVGHPDIRPPRDRRKALHFFDRFGTRELGESDIERYHALFPRAPGQIAGEWTPRYMRDVWTPRLLQRAAPDAKLLVLLRDPIERYRAGLSNRPARRAYGAVATAAVDAVERSRYAVQLRRLRAFYDDEKILVLQLEKCRIDTIGQYRRTLRFLGVTTEHEPSALDGTRATTSEPRKAGWSRQLDEALRIALEPDVERLRELVPHLELELWPNFAHLAADGKADERAPQRA